MGRKSKAEKSISHSDIKAKTKALEEQMSETQKELTSVSKQIMALENKREQLKNGLLILNGSVQALREVVK